MQAAAPNCSPKDFRDLFAWLDADDGQVDQREFVRGFHTLSEPLTGKALLHVDAEVKRRFKKLQEQVDTITADLAQEKRREMEHHQQLLAMLDEEERREQRSPGRNREPYGGSSASGGVTPLAPSVE